MLGRTKMAKYAFVPAQALADERLTKTDLLVLLALGRFANARTGEAFPSQRKVAGLARCTRQTVNRTVKRLAAFGWLDIQARSNERGGRTSSLYRLSFNRTCGVTPIETARVASEATANREGKESKDKYKSAPGSRAAPLAADWQPGPLASELAANELGLSGDAYADALDEFRDYWFSQGELIGACRADWDVVFRNHLRQRFGKLGASRSAAKPTRRSHTRRAAENLDCQVEAFGRFEHEPE